jgi:hypothetical protein
LSSSKRKPASRIVSNSNSAVRNKLPKKSRSHPKNYNNIFNILMQDYKYSEDELFELQKILHHKIRNHFYQNNIKNSNK